MPLFPYELAPDVYRTFNNINVTEQYPETFQGIAAAVHNTILDFFSGFDRKKWLSRADFAKELYSALGAGLVLYSCTTDGGVNASLGLLVSLLLGPGWNLTSIISLSLSLSDWIDLYQKNSTKVNIAIAGSAVITLLALLGGLIWATFSILQSASHEGLSTVFLESSNTLGGVYALAFGIDLPFCLGQLFDAVKAHHTPEQPEEIKYKKSAMIAAEIISAIGAFFALLSMLLEPKPITYLSGAFYTSSPIIKMTILLVVPCILKFCCDKKAEPNHRVDQSLFGADQGANFTLSSVSLGVPANTIN